MSRTAADYWGTKTEPRSMWNLCGIQSSLPFIRRRNDVLQIVVFRPPPEIAHQASGICDERVGVARATWRLDRRDFPADHAGDGLDHFPHAYGAAVTAIERHRAPAVRKMVEREQMRIHKVADMDVIPYPRAVRRRIVGAENLQARYAAKRNLARALDEMRGARRRLSGPSLGVRGGGVEIAQGHEAATMRARSVLEHALGHQFCARVRVV